MFLHPKVYSILSVLALLAIVNGDLFYGPETEDDHATDKDDFVGRHHGESIPKFIDRVVNPKEVYLQKLGKAIHSVAELMKSKLVMFKVSSTVKGGSLGKGTAVRDMADADLLFPLREINSVEKQKEKLPEILKVLQGSLDKSPHKITGIKRTPFTIQFKIMIDGNYEEVDLLPIMDLKSKIGHPTKDNLKQIYVDMKKHPDRRDYYGKCLAFLQVNFVKQFNEKVKKVIRLLKYWTKTRKHALKSYGAELVVIKTYEDMGSPSSVKELDLMINVFESLSDLKSLRISWNTYYNPKDYDIPTAPYILDPAFPYHNLIRQKSGGIDDKYVHLERDAKKILRVLKQQRLANDGHSEL